MVGFAQFISTFQSWVVLYSGESVESESGEDVSGCLDLVNCHQVKNIGLGSHG